MEIVGICLLCLSNIIKLCDGKEVVYYLAIEETDWTYKQADNSDALFRKAVYREYQDQLFATKKLAASPQGILGPVLRATVGDTLKIHVKNRAQHPFSLYTDGLATQRNISGSALLGSPIGSGSSLTYIYNVTDEDGPSAASGEECVTSLYYSDVNVLKNTNSGLVGMIVVCKPGAKTRLSEFFLHFGTIHEEESWYHSTNRSGQSTFLTINGYTGGNLPDIQVCLDRRVRLHMTSLGGHNDVHTVVLYGHQFEVRSRRLDAISLYPGASVQAEFSTLEEGIWQLTTQHSSGNLYGRVIVSTCNGSRPAQQLSGNIRQYFIAAERESQLDGSPGPIVFQEYNDQKFHTKKPSTLPANGRLGPLIYAETLDTVKVVFYNRADRELSLHPHGLRVGKLFEGMFYNDESTGRKAVPPNGLKTYFWSVPEVVSLALYDDPCLARHYTSGVGHGDDTFLFGPLKICEDGYSLTPAREKEIFVIHSRTPTLEEGINGVPSETLALGTLCLKESMNIHIMTQGALGPQSFIAEGSVIKQNSHVFNVLEAKENSISTFNVTFIKTGNWSLRSVRNENVSFPFYVSDCGRVIDFMHSSKTYVRYITIEEGKWSYSLSADWSSKSPGLQMGPEFKKLMYSEYFSNAFFFKKEPPNARDKMLHGPHLAARVGDRIELEVMNGVERQHSLCVDGLSDSANSNINPNTNSKITWDVNEALGPGSADPACILKPYYSRTSLRDVPSGLFGPLVICSPTVPYDTTESTIQQRVFMVGSVDETRSWYLGDNLGAYPRVSNTADPRFAETNSIRAVNGYSDGTIKNMTIPMEKDVYFHFLNIGSSFITIHIYGLQMDPSVQSGVGQATISLYPWASKSIVTRFDTPGSFQYEELTTEGHTTRITGFYTVVVNAKTTV